MSIDRLAIIDMPECYARIMPRRMYLLLSEFKSTAHTLVRHLTCSNSQLIVICQSDLQQLLQPPTSAANASQSSEISLSDTSEAAFQHRVAQGNVLIYQLQPKAKAQTKPIQALRQLLLELVYYVSAKNCLIVLEDAGQWLGINKVDEAAAFFTLWQDFLHANNTSLVCLLPGHVGDPIALHNIRQVEDRLAGFAAFSLKSGKMRMTVQHWYSPSGMCADQQFEIEQSADGVMRAIIDQQQQNEHAKAAATDMDSVWAHVDVVRGEEVPQTWKVSGDLLQLEQACVSAVSGCVILPYLQNTKLETLARFVYRLRKSHGDQLKIVIREVSARMRHSEEKLLRFMGATMVVPIEVVFSRLLGVLDSLQDMVFEGELAEDFEQTFMLASPVQKQGYLRPGEFLQHVKQLMIQTQNFDIHFAFVKLKVYRAMNVRDALKIAQIRRLGDVCSTDNNCLYLFLFGCRESDISTALKFIFGIPTAQLFESEVRDTSFDETFLALELFEKSIHKDGAKDHSQWLNKNQANDASENGSIKPIQQNKSAFDRSPPKAAIARPLPLKIHQE